MLENDSIKNSITIIKWAENMLLQQGYTVSTQPQQILNTPWSNILRFSTNQGECYLKQTPFKLSQEPFIIRVLHDDCDGNVPIILDANKELSCFLMKDAGNSLHHVLIKNFRPALLAQAIKKYTRLQFSSIDHINTFLALGMPDWRLDKLPYLYHHLLNNETLLKEEGLSVTELKTLQALHPALASLCEQLTSHDIPETIDHSDFHANNILIEPNTHEITLIDWGETVLSHPFFSLINCLDHAAYHYGLSDADPAYRALQEAGLAQWLNITSEDNLLACFSLTKKLWPLYRALAFYRCMAACDPEKFKAYSVKRPHRLAGYLRDFVTTMRIG